MDFSNYKFRAHAIGGIMGGAPRPLTAKQRKTYAAHTERKNGKGRPLTDRQLADWGALHTREAARPKLTAAAKKYLDKLVWEELTGRRSSLKGKYLDKGVMAKQRGLDLYRAVKGGPAAGNEKRAENGFFSGRCDIARYKVRDIRTSWSFDTFPLQSGNVPSADREWQLDVYMELYGYKRAELVYCLVDTPHGLIEEELGRLDRRLGIFDGKGRVRESARELVVETVANHIYTAEGLESFCGQRPSVRIEWFGGFRELPQEMRVRVFKREYSRERVDLMVDMVRLARGYMNGAVAKIQNYELRIMNSEL